MGFAITVDPLLDLRHLPVVQVEYTQSKFLRGGPYLMNMMIRTTGMTTATVATITPATAGPATDDDPPVETQQIILANMHYSSL